MRHPLAVLLLLFALPLAQAQDDAAPANITVYRCVGKDGVVALRDQPCAPGEAQQVRELAKPKEAPAQDAAPVAAVAEPAPRERIVVRTPIQPMYECTDIETGATYTSDVDSGNPRWINDYVVGIAGAFSSPRPPHGPPPPKPGTPIWQGHPGHGVIPDAPPAPTRLPSAALAGSTGVLLPAGGHMVHDSCNMLPQAEACARLNDRRYEILKSYGVVSQDKEHQLAREQRGIDARMANDCGTD